MSEKATQWQPTARDRDTFDFLWQHRRRNPDYLKAWSEHLALEIRRGLLQREIAAERTKLNAKLKARGKKAKAKAKRTGRMVYIGSIPLETAKERELRELSASSNSLLLAAELSGLWGGGLIDPAHDTDEAMHEALANSRGSFGPAEWRRVARRLSAPAAIWNWRGSEGCAWQNTPSESGDFHTFDELQTVLEDAERRGDIEAVSKCRAKVRELLAKHSGGRPPSGDSHTFETLEMMLTETAEQVKKAGRMEALAKRRGLSPQQARMTANMIAPGSICSRFQGTVAEYRALCDQYHAEAKARMKKFLQDHSLMDFVLNTRLPFGTVKDELGRVFERIKRLRVDVGLDRDEHAGELPAKWKDYLALYDACEPRRRRRAALRQIEKQGLGFVDSFRLLEVALPADQMAFARKLDAAEKKPAEVFNIFVELERDPGRPVARVPQAARGEYRDDSQPREQVAASGPEDAEDFDYDAIDANLGRTEPTVRSDAEGSVNTGEAAFLREWLPHFAVPAVTLPDSAKNQPTSTRKSWLREARRRIAAA